MKRLLNLLSVVAIMCVSARAEEATFTFRGTMHELDTEFSYFGGRPFEITYSFELATADANPGDPESGRYIGAIKSGRLTLFADGKTYHWLIKPDGPDNIIEVKHLKNADSYSVSASLLPQGSGNDIPVTFVIELIDDSATALGKDALPSVLKLELFDSQKVVKFTFTGFLQHIYGTWGIITSADTPH